MAFPPTIDCAKQISKRILAALATVKVATDRVSILAKLHSEASWNQAFQVVNRSVIQRQTNVWTTTTLYRDINMIVELFAFCGSLGREVEAAHADAVEETLATFCDCVLSLVVKTDDPPDTPEILKVLDGMSMGGLQQALVALELEEPILLLEMLPVYLEIACLVIQETRQKWELRTSNIVLVSAVHAVMKECAAALLGTHLAKERGLRRKFEKHMDEMESQEDGQVLSLLQPASNLQFTLQTRRQ